MTFNATLASLNGRAWALSDEAAPAIRDLMAAEARGEKLAGRLAAVGGGGRASSATQGAVQVIPVMGIITQSIDWIGTSTMWISAQLRRALSDPGVSAIVLDVASPGGTVSGTPEVADEIFRARSAKPIVAFVNPLAASAAYWIASQASEIIMTRSGYAGSIGVFRLHMDLSGAMEQAGIRPTYISAGKFKTEINPYEPLGAEAKAYEQSQIDSIYSDFIAAVARGRGVPAAKVRADFGQGRCMLAADAVRAGMADRIGTLADAVGRAATRARTAASSPTARAFAGDPAKAERHRRLAELARDPAAEARARRLRLLRASC